MPEIFEENLPLADFDEARILFGAHDKNLRYLKQFFDCEIFTRQGQIRVRGRDEAVVEDAYQVLKHLLQKIKKYGSLSQRDLETIVQGHGNSQPAAVMPAAPVIDDTHVKREKVLARTPGQKAYVDAMLKHDLIFVTGPAGTGKTYLAVATAVQGLRAGHFRRVILVRPAVEAGERLGFLPGDMLQKVHPYLAPLFDCLKDWMDAAAVQRLLDTGVIEVIPLAYMRGRTLNSAFVIMDEAQNTTVKQMKMFLTRLGNDSKMIVTGDDTQVDLPAGTTSGLTHARNILRQVKTIGFVELGKQDIVRHPLVQEVITAFEQAERNPFDRYRGQFGAEAGDDAPVREI